MSEPLRVTAIIAAHNEEDIIGQVVGDLVEQGVSVYFMDHSSTDDTLAEVERYRDRGLVGVERFFEVLGQLANGVLLDNRVILAARQLWPSAIDRFNSDLYRWGEVEDPFLQGLTRAAAEAPIPVVMGGHSVVGGGLMALTETLAPGGMHSDGGRAV